MTHQDEYHAVLVKTKGVYAYNNIIMTALWPKQAWENTTWKLNCISYFGFKVIYFFRGLILHWNIKMAQPMLNHLKPHYTLSWFSITVVLNLCEIVARWFLFYKTRAQYNCGPRPGGWETLLYNIVLPFVPLTLKRLSRVFDQNILSISHFSPYELH
jgi:hypothetical protein